MLLNANCHVYCKSFKLIDYIYDRNFMCYLYEYKFQAGFITSFVKDLKNPMCIIGDLHGSCAQQSSS